MITVRELGQKDIEKMGKVLARYRNIERDKEYVSGGVFGLLARLTQQVDLDPSFSAFRDMLIQAVTDYEARRTADQKALEISPGEERSI